MIKKNGDYEPEERGRNRRKKKKDCKPKAEARHR